jgi:hypothetical protein
MTRSILVISPVLAVLTAVSCGSDGGGAVAPTPPRDPATQVTPLDTSGPIRISFLSANVSPGSVVSGCGPLIEGCAGRLRLTLRIEPPNDGPVLYTRIYLHATNLIACLWGETDPFTVRAGVTQTIDVSMDRTDRCGTPTDIATMAAVVEGPTQIESRQTWSLRYVFAP